MADAMREALEKIAASDPSEDGCYYTNRANISIARKALAAQKPAQGEAEKLPVCPHCKTTLREVHFIGYYDDFYHWDCECETLPGAKVEKGGYA